MKPKNKNILLLFLIAAVVCLGLLHTCENKTVKMYGGVLVGPLKENVNKIIDKIKTDELIIDSLLKLKPKIITRYKNKTDSIFISAPDTCKSYIIQVKNECLTVDSVNEVIIATQGNQINNYSAAVEGLNSIVKIQNDQLNDSSKVITQLKKDVKKEKRNGKLKAVFLSIASSLAGFGLGSIK